MKLNSGARTRNRTKDTGIFNPRVLNGRVSWLHTIEVCTNENTARCLHQRW